MELLITRDDITIRAFDPFNYFYLDSKCFFSKQILLESKKSKDLKEDGGEVVFMLKMEDLEKTLPKISKSGIIEISVSKNNLIITRSHKNLVSSYSIYMEEITNPIFPTPKKNSYAYKTNINCLDFYEGLTSLIQTSNEIIFTTSRANNKIIIRADSTRLSSKIELRTENARGQNLEFKIIFQYLKNIGNLIKKSDTLKVNLSNKVPALFNLLKKRSFEINFYFSHERNFKSPIDQSKITLPLVNMTNFTQFLEHIYNQDQNSERVFVLSTMELETKGGDNTRFGKMLGLTERTRGDIYLTDDGKEIIKTLVEDLETGKQFIRDIFLTKFPFFKILTEDFDFSKPKTASILYFEFKDKLRERYPDNQIKELDFNTAIHILSWCREFRFEKGLIVSE